uniref:Uncharacterized protein n=1 Tax=Moniliophthora roreri TaxID=221103 RepID=A0A0W0G040_MONRR
MSRCICLCQ